MCENVEFYNRHFGMYKFEGLTSVNQYYSCRKVGIVFNVSRVTRIVAQVF